MRAAVVATLALGLFNFAQADHAIASIKHPTDIPAQPLEPALEALANQLNLQILYQSDLVKNLKTGGAVGQLTVDQTLIRVLSGTGLTYRYLQDDAITIEPIAQKNSTAPAPTAQSDDLWGRFRLAQADGASYTAVGASSSDAEGRVALQEVIVTAQKRAERLQDVPIPVSVLNTESLASTGQVRLVDYAYSVPGLAVNPGYHGHQFITIRGISTGGVQNPTVGIMIDDLPFGASTSNSEFDAPDIDPGDLSRIEVLRGPQGTLYGASSMGGLIKFVTKDPSFDGYSGRFEAGTNSVHNGTQPGFDFRASANVPLSDTVAMRASGFRREDAGYIDNPIRGLQGVNQGDAWGGRWSMLWKPSGDLSIKLSALYEKSRQFGSSDVTALPGLGDLQQDYLPGLGGADRTSQAYSATLNAKLGSVDVTSVTGYSVSRVFDTLDEDHGGAGGTPLFGIAGLRIQLLNQTRKFSQEVRATTSLGSSFDLLVGAFYTHERGFAPGAFFAPDPISGQLINEYDFGDEGSYYSEYAGFADLTYHVTDRFDVQVGGRESHNTVGLDASTNDGPLNGGLSFLPGSAVHANVFTYLFSPQFKLTPDLMAYARLASGYRPGGPNIPHPAGVPEAFTPDRTKNYEVGLKGDFLDHKLSLDSSLYYIDWTQVQFHVTSNAIGYNGNGGTAKSEGVELSVTARPVTGLTVSGWIDYDDAVIKQPAPGVTVFLQSGTRLPYSSRFSGNLSVNDEFALWGDAVGFVGGVASIVGDRQGIFRGWADSARTTPLPRQDFPSYTKIDLTAGLRKDSWTTTLYVTNVGDKRGLVDGGNGYAPGQFAFIYIQPRTVGVTVAKTFH